MVKGDRIRDYLYKFFVKIELLLLELKVKNWISFQGEYIIWKQKAGDDLDVCVPYLQVA